MLSKIERVYENVELLELARKAAGADAQLASNDDLFAVVSAAHELRALAGLIEAGAVAEIEARDAANRDHGLRTVSWLAREGKVAGVTARRRVKVAKALRRLPGVEAALAAGTISFDHAWVLTEAVANPRVGDDIVELADALVAEAAGKVFERWRDEVRALVELLDEDGGHDPAKDPTQNRLSYAKTLDGVTHVKVTLVGDGAEATIHALNVMADELYRRCAKDNARCPEIEIPGRAQLLAEALVELTRRGGAVDLASSTPPRAEVTYVVRHDDPDVVLDANGVRLGDRGGFPRCCDPDFYAVIMDSLGQPVDLGRKTRLASPHQRRAIAARDGGCVFPGCDRPIEWLDIHHADWWEHGGHTRIDRLCGLCRFHHGVAHRNGWHLGMDDTAWVWFETPKGHAFWGQRHGHRRAGPAPPASADRHARAA
jgi:hypothetical protein